MTLINMTLKFEKLLPKFLLQGRVDRDLRRQVPLFIHFRRLSYKDIPRSPSVPFLGSMPYLIKAGGPSQLHNYADRLHKSLGPMFVDRNMGMEMLFTSDPEANLQVYRSEGPYPEHFVLEAWTLYLKDTGQKRGLFFMDGPEWKTNRQILAKILMRTDSMEAHVQGVARICKELVEMWKSKPPKEHLEYQLLNFNIECIGDISLGMKLGFIEKLKTDNGRNGTKAYKDEFVKSIHNIFLESVNLYVLPAKLAKRLQLGAWKRFCSAVSTALQGGREFIQKGIEEIESNPNERNQSSILFMLLKEAKIDPETATILLTDLFLASADTASHTASWIFYLLGRNPEAAQKGREEINSVLAQDSTITIATLNKLSYVRGILKEAMRMYPIAPFLTRRLAKESSINGYTIPSGTMIIFSIYTMGRDPRNFSSPDSFLPERWIRDQNIRREICPHSSELEVHNAKAYVPWGLGGRSCIGKRIAELELTLLVMEVLRTFEWTTDEEIDMVLRMVSVPSKNVILNLRPIKSQTL